MSKKYSVPSYEKNMIGHILKQFLFLCYSAEFLHHSFGYLLWLSARPFVDEFVYESIPVVAPIASFLKSDLSPCSASGELNGDQVMTVARRALGHQCLTLPAITSLLSHIRLHLASTTQLLNTQPTL